ncbi:hypothetical protein [Aeromonas salmonicida]
MGGRRHIQLTGPHFTAVEQGVARQSGMPGQQRPQIAPLHPLPVQFTTAFHPSPVFKLTQLKSEASGPQGTAVDQLSPFHLQGSVSHPLALLLYLVDHQGLTPIAKPSTLLQQTFAAQTQRSPGNQGGTLLVTPLSHLKIGCLLTGKTPLVSERIGLQLPLSCLPVTIQRQLLTCALQQPSDPPHASQLLRIPLQGQGATDVRIPPQRQQSCTQLDRALADKTPCQGCLISLEIKSLLAL